MKLLPEDPNRISTFVYVESLDFEDGRQERPPARVSSGWEGVDYLYFVVADTSIRAEVTLVQSGPSGDEPISRIEVFYHATPGSKDTMCTGFRELYTYHPVEVSVDNLPEQGTYRASLEGCHGEREVDWQGRTLIWVGDKPCILRVVLRDQGLRAESAGLTVDQSSDSLTLQAPALSELAPYPLSLLDDLQADVERGTGSCVRLAQGNARRLDRCLSWRVAPVQAELDAALEALDDLKEE